MTPPCRPRGHHRLGGAATRRPMADDVVGMRGVHRPAVGGHRRVATGVARLREPRGLDLIVNSARIGFTRTVWNEGFPTDPSGQFGTAGNSKVGISFSNQAYDGFSFQSFKNNDLSGVGTPAFNDGLIDNTYSYIDNLTWQRGKHTIDLGIQGMRYENNYPTSNNDGYLGSLTYTGLFSSNPSASNAGGYDGADFVLDRVSSAAATLTSVNVGQRQWRVAGFVNDDYRVLPDLTLNFGVRYEYDEPWVEEKNKTGNINIATGQVIYANAVPPGAPVGSGVCSNRACYNSDFKQIMPRLGFDYQANGRLVIRGGYGAQSFFEGNSSNQRLTSITPFIQAVNISTVAPTPGNPGTPRTAQQGFGGGTISYGGTFNVYPQNIQPAYVQEWNLRPNTQSAGRCRYRLAIWVNKVSTSRTMEI